MHGNLSQNARERALKRFESGHVSTLVATDVAARGLDVDDITHVINFDPPRADEDYVHRVGRTGRAGRSGTGVTFVLPEQQTDVGKLAVRLGHGAAFAASGMRQTATRRRLAAAAADARPYRRRPSPRPRTTTPANRPTHSIAPLTRPSTPLDSKTAPLTATNPAASRPRETSTPAACR